MLKLIMGTAGSGKTLGILNEIKENAQAGIKGQCLIVPEQYSHEAEREMCAVCGDEISLHAEVLSFSRLALRVAQEAGSGGRVILDKAGRFLCVSLALEQIGEILSIYSAINRSPEFRYSLFGTIEELRTAGVSPDDLIEASAHSEGKLSGKLRDLSLCLESYNAVLAQGHADTTDRLTRLAETIHHSSVGQGKIYIDGFTDFTYSEMLVIEAMMKKGMDVTVCLTCDGFEGLGEQFEPSRRTAFALKHIAEKYNAEVESVNISSVSDKSATLRFFGEQLLSYTGETISDEEQRITLLKCDGIHAECEMAAARCIELVQDTKCHWRDLAVAVRGFSDYSAPLEDTFRFYGVPLFTARRENILQKPAAALISLAFDIIEGGWDLGDVLEYFKTGLSGLEQEDCDALEDYATLWNIRGSYWYRNKGFTMHPNGFARKWDDDSREKLRYLESLRRKLCTPLLRLEKNAKLAETAAQQAMSLVKYLEDIKLPETLASRADELNNADRAQLASETSQLWDIIVGALEQFVALLGDAPMKQTEFYGLFLKALSQYDVSVIPSSSDSVSAGEMDRMRRRHIKHLIILGASDDRIPALSEAGGILSQEERDELREIGIDLGGGDALQREFSLIYNCISLPSETLTISYSSSGSNKARPSFLITRAEALFGIKAQDSDINAVRSFALRPAFLLAAKGVPFARSYFASDPDHKKRLVELEKRSLSERGSLSPLIVEALYGQKKTLSPSQLEVFSGCRLSYFLRYGLRLDKKEPANFTPPEIGTYLHFVLEKSIGEISEGIGFENANDELVSALAEKYTELYVSERISDYDDKPQRFKYLFRRMAPSVRRIVADMVRELSRSDFRPLDFELSFMRDGDMPPVESKNGLRVVGVADRVDGYEHDGKLFLRVIDYKTGKKSFSLSDIRNGIGLQMPIYLFALEDLGKARYGKPIVPAGVMYVPAKDSLISTASDISDEELLREQTKKRRRSGLLLNDENILHAMEHGDNFEYIPVERRKGGSLSADSLASAEQMGKLKSFLSESIASVSQELSSGSIEAEPAYRSESDNSCKWCPYLRICRFDETKDKRRYLTKIKPAEFWSELEEKHNGQTGAH